MAGVETATFRNVCLQAGAKNLLFSAFYYGYNKTLPQLPEQNIIIDSGGYTARKKNTKIDIKEYIDFINTNKVKVAFNLDTNNVEETLQNQKLLDMHTDCQILPVYHVSDYINRKTTTLINEFAEQYNFIGLGGMSGIKVSRDLFLRFLRYVFSITKDKIKIHALGVTTARLMEQFPFYSVDSTTWLNGAKYGECIDFKAGLVKHKSPRSIKTSDKVTSASIMMPRHGRLLMSARAFVQYEKYVTELWQKRGIKWD
jgi:hypothetical protein